MPLTVKGRLSSQVVMNCGSSVRTYFDTTGLTIGGGKMGWAKLLSDGTLLYVCMRHPTDASKVGVAIVNQTTRATLFSWNDLSWSQSGGEYAGPETAQVLSNGDILIPTIDGYLGSYGSPLYVVRQDGTFVWKWLGSATSDKNIGTNLVKCVTIGGTDYILIFGCGLTNRRGMEVIRRDTQATVFHLALSSVNEVSDGDFRNIGGVNYIVASIWVDDPLVYLVNFDTQSLVKSVDLGTLLGQSGSGWSLVWVDDDTWHVTGFNASISVVTGVVNWIAGTGSLALAWKSPKFPEDVAGSTPTTCFQNTSGRQALVTTRSEIASPGIIFEVKYGP